jgi:hypothetical protein
MLDGEPIGSKALMFHLVPNVQAVTLAATTGRLLQLFIARTAW